MRIDLEKYRGTKSRHICPACNSRNCFVRYVGETGEYIAEDVGRCNRESSCGYHYKPKQYFADNPQAKDANFKKKKRKAANYGFTEKKESVNLPILTKPDYIPFEQFKQTLGNYDRNAFVQFLFNLFPDCPEEIENVLKMYFVGTYEDYTCFPSIDRLNRICRTKLIRFNSAIGKRLKGDYDTSSLPSKLKLKDFNYKQIFFGEHLLSKCPDKPVGIVEAEKTAIIASLCFPEFVWLACNSRTWLKPERIQTLGDKQIILYPDADGFKLWQEIAARARRNGVSVNVSYLIDTFATAEQKANGFDLADYLINQQREINQFNDYADDYNARLETVLNSELLNREFNTILNERKAIMMIDGNVAEVEAEKLLSDSEDFRQIVTNLTV